MTLPRRRQQLALIAALLAACLLPFAAKPLHIDDPLFVWAAEQIRAEPLDFYGFELNWYGRPHPMWLTMKNPPGVSYYLALVISVVGKSEIALHLALFLPALAAAWGTWFLARRFAAPPLVATAIAVLSPGFLISATTVMCDVPMLALWIWAVYFWDRGLERGGWGSPLAASLLVAACSLTKYFGMALLPLLVAATLIGPRRRWRNLVALALPVVVLAAYQWGTIVRYDRGLLFDAAGYAVARQAETLPQLIGRLVTGLSFTGGCAASVACLAPLLLTRRRALAGAVAVAALVPLLALDPVIERLNLQLASRPWILPQLALWIVAGAGMLALVLAELRARRDRGILLLALWCGGTFLFAAGVNWTVNGRSVLPLIPALAILVARRLADAAERHRGRLAGGLVAAALLALVATWADHGLARSAQTAARALAVRYGDEPGRLWFQGHWGFQYYAEQSGALALNMVRPEFRGGEIVLVPLANTNVTEIAPRFAELVATVEFPAPRWVSTMGFRRGPGFYSSIWGPLPFSFGPFRQEPYLVYRVRAPAG